MSDRALEAARASGLIVPGAPLLVMLSGGADSVCLLDVAVRLGARVSALHVNYGLRAEAGEDEEHCRALAASLEVPLSVEHVSLASAEGAGNLQAEAREARYRLAGRHAGDGDHAAAHTASDQAETVLYRLAVSPGRRALLGMEPRRGRLVRPLLEVTRADTRLHCRARGLRWREDRLNADRAFARARIRHDVLPVLEEMRPGAERTIAETSLLLRDEAEVLEAAVDEALARLGDRVIPLPELRRLPRGLARLVLRRLAENASGGGPAPLSRADADAVLALGSSGGTATLDLGGGLRAIAEYGTLRFTREADAEAPPPARLPVPGVVRFGVWEVETRLTGGPPPRPGEDGVLPAVALGAGATVRAWEPGDRIRPIGLGGTKTLQDLFTDRKVPRPLRHTLPVVEAGGEVLWVAGVATAEVELEADGEWVVLSARKKG